MFIDSGLLVGLRRQKLLQALPVCCASPQKKTKSLHVQEAVIAKNLRATGQNVLKVTLFSSEGHPILFPFFKAPRTFVGMLLCEQLTHCMWVLWLKINIQRSAVKRQKDHGPLLQAVVRQRRSYYPYTPIHFDPYYTALQPRVVVTPRDSNPNYVVTEFVVDSPPGRLSAVGLQVVPAEDCNCGTLNPFESYWQPYNWFFRKPRDCNIRQSQFQWFQGYVKKLVTTCGPGGGEKKRSSSASLSTPRRSVKAVMSPVRKRRGQNRPQVQVRQRSLKRTRPPGRKWKRLRAIWKIYGECVSRRSPS